MYYIDTQNSGLWRPVFVSSCKRKCLNFVENQLQLLLLCKNEWLSYGIYTRNFFGGWGQEPGSGKNYPVGEKNKMFQFCIELKPDNIPGV